MKYPRAVVIISLRGGKKSRNASTDGLTHMWDSGTSDSMIKRKTNNPYK